MGGELESEHQVEKIHGQLLNISFKTFGRITVSLPLGSLFVCFMTAIIFQFNEVNKTVCNVQNLIPSISAITGVTPGRYIWRICIALHSTPRFVVGLMYYNYYHARIKYIAISQRYWYRKLVHFNFWCYMLENSCLIGVTYIANVENYPVHEKMFVVFMVTSLIYELMTIVLFRWSHPEMETNPRIKKSYRLKKGFFLALVSFTAGLLYFFLRHRLYCEPNAFSFFSAFEYGIAVTNICFHYTAVREFEERNWYVGISGDSSQKPRNSTNDAYISDVANGNSNMKSRNKKYF